MSSSEPKKTISERYVVGSSGRVRAKLPLLDAIATEVLKRLNTKDRNLGYHGKGIQGRFIPEENIDIVQESLKDAISLILWENGIVVEGKKHDFEDHYYVPWRLKNKLAEAYQLEADGRVVRCALEQIERVTLQLVNESRLFPTRLKEGLHRNF